jgi:UvrB/uvrC motif/SnoaL-like domain
VSDPSLAELEQQLAAAVEAEDYSKAATLRDSIAAAKHDGNAAVEYANEKFYKAFATCDVDAMDRIWGEGDYVQCTHPMTPVLVGVYQLTGIRHSSVCLRAGPVRVALQVCELANDACV